MSHASRFTLHALAFLVGTMLANMVTTLFILPPLLWFILSKQDLTGLKNLSSLFKPKLIFQAIALACLPLLSYTYVFISGALHPEWRGIGEWPSAWAWFVDFLTIQQGRDELTPGLSLQNFFTAEFPALMGQELTWFIFIGGLSGLAFLGRRRAIFLYSTLLIYFVFCWLYRFGNWFQVITPAYPIFIIGTAAGLNRISAEAKKRSQFIIHYSLFIILLLIALLLYRFTTNFPRANQSHLPTDTGLDPGWAILADRPTPPALISTDFPEQVALQYLKIVWGAAAGLDPVPVGNFSPPVGQADSLSYLSRRAAAVAPGALRLPEVYPQAAGEQLLALPFTPLTDLPTSTTPLDLSFGPSLKLVGWQQINPAYPLPGDVARRLARANWQIALFWQTEQPLNEDYTISVRPLVGGQLITANGEALIQDHQPVWGFYPTSRWRPGEVVRDVYALNLPAEVTPKAVQIVVYKATDAGFENLAEQTIILQ